MATKSILKTVHIKDAKAAKKLISAIENAGGKEPTPIRFSRKVTEATAEDVRLMFEAR